jgi:hypothetical protein
MTNKGAVQSHEEGAIPIMLHYMIFANSNKIMDCADSSGRMASAKERGGFIMNYDKTVDIPVSAFAGLEKAELIDLQNFKTTNVPFQYDGKQENYRVYIPDAKYGANLLKLSDAAGRHFYKGLIYDEPQFLEDDNYNPITLDNNGAYLLDMTLLEDRVSKVILYTAAGQPIHIFNDPYAIQQLAEAGSLQNGEYVVEVHGQAMRYYLKFEVGKKTAPVFTLFPNPFRNIITIEGNTALQTSIRIFGADGKEYVLPQKLSVGRWEINAASLPAGLYAIQVQNADIMYTEKLVKF